MIAKNGISSAIILGTLSYVSFLSNAFADTTPPTQTQTSPQVQTTPAQTTPQTTTQTQTSMSDISGNYLCNYHDPIFSTPPDGTEVLMIKKVNDHYTMAKRGESDTTPVIIGVGIPNTDQPNVLSFLFWRLTNSTSTFVQYIALKPDGTLQGEWAVSNKNGTASFTCKKSS